MECMSCGTVNEVGNNFCENCGIKLKGSSLQNDSLAGNEKRLEIVSNNNLAVISDIGLRYKSNQDYGNVLINEKGNTILVVADGVSASTNPSSASKIAVNTVSRILSSYEGGNFTDILKTAIKTAHQEILDTTSGDTESAETTIVAAIVAQDLITVGWVGDSRAYIIDGEEEQQITVDDSWIEEEVTAGKLTREEALKDKRAHMITQALGMKDEPIDIHIVQKTLPKGALLLLCTDGLWNYLPNSKDVSCYLAGYQWTNAHDICRYMCDFALEKGGRDNVTIAVYTLKFDKEL